MGARLAHGSHEIVFLGIGVLDQVREHLGIGLALEVMARSLELLAQLGEVLDDAVVDDGDAPVAARMRVRVGDGRFAVRGPAGVADAAGRRLVCIDKHALEPGDLAHAAHHIEGRVRALTHLERHTGRVVSAIFKTFEPGDEDVLCHAPTGKSDDSAHSYPFFVRWI